MKRPYSALLFMLFFYQLSHAQLSFKCGPELGITVFFPEGSSNITHVHSPLIGFTTETTIGRHIQLNLGAQYQKNEEEQYSHEYRLNNTIVADSWNKQLFHKLCFPVNLGYTITLWKFHPAVFLGYRFNYFMAGKYYNKYVSSKTGETEEINLNPMDQNQMETPVNRFNNQLLFGASCGIGKHLKLTASGNFGNNISYTQIKTGGTQVFQNKDYIVSLIYFF